MFGVKLRTALVVRASKLCESEGEASVGEELASVGEELASVRMSASPGRGTELGVSKNTSGSTSSSEMDSSASSSSGT